MLILPKTNEELINVVKEIHRYNISFKMIGATSNIFFLDDEVYNVFICTRDIDFILIDDTSESVTVSAGLMLPKFAKKISSLGFSGFEGLIGIPGTIGGAIYMNAGAYGNSISDLIRDVTIITVDGDIKTILRDEMVFSFRKSPFQNIINGVIIEASFELNRACKADVKSNIDKNIRNRMKFQESSLPNLGSIFSTYDIYNDIAKNNHAYRFLLFVVRKIYRIAKHDNNVLLNYVTALFFRWNFSSKPYSDKTLNCLVNRGADTNELLSYIKKLKEILQEY